MFNWPMVALAGLLAGTCLWFGGVSAAEPVRGQPMVIPTVVLPGGGMGLRADLDGHPGLFLFDTGAGVTIVTPELAQAAGCRPWGRLTGFRATGERLDTPRCDSLPVKLGGRTFTAPIASVLDINQLMGAGMPKLSGLMALDLFAGRSITIRPVAHELVMETATSLKRRTQDAREVPIRAVRDTEGVALTVDGAVQTTDGRAWMELDIGNLGPLLIGEHVAALLGLSAGSHDRQPADFSLVGGIPVGGPARVQNLIMDGDIGEAELGRWDMTLDLASMRAWFRPAMAGGG